MKLFFSPSSPFARKVMVTAHESGLADRLEITVAGAHPVNRNDAIRAENPLGQIPTLVADDGQALYDSRVICEYLDGMAGGRLFGSGAERWRILTDQALADGLMGAALLHRYENNVRPDQFRWNDWSGGQMEKVTDALDRLEKVLAKAGDRLDIGTIAAGCALGYLDFRYGDLGWRTKRPGLAAWFERFGSRPSMQATTPKG